MARMMMQAVTMMMRQYAMFAILFILTISMLLPDAQARKVDPDDYSIMRQEHRTGEVSIFYSDGSTDVDQYGIKYNSGREPLPERKQDRGAGQELYQQLSDSDVSGPDFEQDPDAPDALHGFASADGRVWKNERYQVVDEDEDGNPDYYVDMSGVRYNPDGTMVNPLTYDKMESAKNAVKAMVEGYALRAADTSFAEFEQGFSNVMGFLEGVGLDFSWANGMRDDYLEKKRKRLAGDWGVGLNTLVYGAEGLTASACYLGQFFPDLVDARLGLSGTDMSDLSSARHCPTGVCVSIASEMLNISGYPDQEYDYAYSLELQIVPPACSGSSTDGVCDAVWEYMVTFRNDEGEYNVFMEDAVPLGDTPILWGSAAQVFYNNTEFDTVELEILNADAREHIKGYYLDEDVTKAGNPFVVRIVKR